jgi:hypothetical protein
MVRRTEKQWRDIFEAQQDSGVNVAQFCRQHKLNAKYFSLRKRQLSAGEPSGFIQAKLSTKESGNHQAVKVSRIRVIEFELDTGRLDAESILGYLLR